MYWGTLAAISFLATAMSWHLRSHPQLLSDEDTQARTPASRLASLRGPILGAYFLAIGLMTLVAPMISSWMPLGIILLAAWLRPAADEEPD